jgi:hypothetical protein
VDQPNRARSVRRLLSAWEAPQVIGNGILIDQVNGLPETERATGAAVVQDFAEKQLDPRCRCLRRHRKPGIHHRGHRGWDCPSPRRRALSVTVLLGLAGFLITANPPPFGPTGLALFIAAVLLLMRRDSAANTTVPSAQPAST